MKTIGLIGGMSWESSLEYYRILNQTVAKKRGGCHSAKCILHSFDFEEIAHLQHREEWEKLTRIMIDAAQKLKNAGADFIVICTNTMHLMVDRIEEEVGIEVLHIGDATAKCIVEQAIKKVALLGTTFTMTADFYKDRLSKFGIEVIIPNEQDRQIVHNIIYHELVKGIISDASKNEYQRIIMSLTQDGAKGVILGCTEIPLLTKQGDVDIPVFDTTSIHAEAAIALACK